MGELLVACDTCGLDYPTNEMNWLDSGAALCEECLEQEAEVEEFIPPRPDPVPFFCMYNEAGRILHVTDDITTPLQWKSLQGEDWWWFSVSMIYVAWAPDIQTAKANVKKMIHRVAPIYVKPQDYTSEERADPVRIVEDAKDRTVSFRIPQDIDREITKVCGDLGISRSDWFRHVVQNDLQRVSEFR